MSDPAKQTIEAMQKNPTGCMVLGGKRQLSGVFWTDKEIEEGTLYLNLIGGISHQAVTGGRVTKERLIAYLDGLLK